VRAAGGDGAAAREAVAALCRDYWFPLYAFVRRKGVGAEDAEDVVQGFFAELLLKFDFSRLAPERGRFRSFLLAGVQHHLANVRDRADAAKRGGDRTRVPIDFADADARFALQARDEDPGKAFEREWALALLERALALLEQEYRASDRGELFDVLKGELAGGAEERYASYAARLGASEAAVKVAVHRLRKRYRERLRAEIAGTVVDERDVDLEIADLFRALGS
jgi:RNA polymerase sigma-70 factor (ECF subfamily)